MGVIQNNGTVQSWKGIPSAVFECGQHYHRPYRCVQFTLAPYGVHNAYLGPGSPGTEDCLKLFVWKPARARQNAKLPVMGGGLVFGDGLQDEYGDWVGHDQKFIAVNMNYRLGMLGFMNHPDLPSANAGLLDQRMAMRWVKQNIAAFGGDPDNITIISQSGGGWAIAAQLGLYDGQANGTFQRAIARSIQREPLFTTKELMLRNTVLSEQLNCTSADQLACFRSVSVPDLVDIFQNMSIANGTECNPFIQKWKKQPTYLRLLDVTNRITNLTDAEVYEVASFYPVSAGYGAVTPDNFFLDVFKSYWMALGFFAVRASFNGSYPLAPVTHSSENTYLNYPLSTMTDYERVVAVEFRAYLSSFIRTGNPNTHKVATAPH
ncbi:Carboxylesterase, type B [Penicillium expansum]|nr:Carboxylesterase, type B [Penicillium expansum]KGO70895.1 Carboxylesterase, type B [Penicillium expansum]